MKRQRRLRSGLSISAFAALLWTASGTLSPAAQPTTPPDPAVQAAPTPDLPPLLEPVTVEGNTGSNGAGAGAEVALPSSLPSTAEASTSRGLFESLIGETSSASAGFAGQSDLQSRPFWRGADIIELVPQLFANEHAGGGKATEFFIRGVPSFHGTDFSLFVDGVPLNAGSHAHGQGYADMNFLIPELIEFIEFKKGPYYVDVGDFSTVGTAQMHTVRSLENGFIKVERGQYDYYRIVNANSYEYAGGDLLYGVEARYFDGPWSEPERLQKITGMLKWSIGDDDCGLSLTTQALNNQWTNANQIPERYVNAGNSRFSNLSPTDGGVTNRYGLNLNFWNETADGAKTTFDAWSYYNQLDLYGTFKLGIEPQVNQFDRRIVSGARLEHSWDANVETPIRHTAGVWYRNDTCPIVRLDRTTDRVVDEVASDNHISLNNWAIYYSNEIRYTDWLRSVQGIRADWYSMDVDAINQPLNSGASTRGISQPKVALILGPWAETEFFVNYGLGFHTNDARGVFNTVAVDEDTGALVPADQTPMFVQTQGGELGIRSNVVEGWNSTFALYYLQLDSELLFEGDDGAVIPSGATERYGIEWNNFIQVTDWLLFDCEIGNAHSRYLQDMESGEVPGVIGRFIPTAPDWMVATGATVRFSEQWFATLRYRHFGSRPLIEDNSVRSEATNTFNVRFGYQGKKLAAGLDLLNIFNSNDPEISYFYNTQLPGEVAPVADRLNHPLLPFQWRVYLSYAY